MSTVAGNIRTLLLANGAVSARVGASRIYRGRLPQEPTLPCILIQMIDDIPVTSHSGQSSLRRPMFQLTHFAADHKVAEEMDDETKAVLEGFQGTMGDLTGVTVLRVDGRDDLEPDLDWAVRSADYQVWYN